VSHGRSDLVCSFIMKLRCKTLFFYSYMHEDRSEEQNTTRVG
jgi:hypothetical protein